VVNSVLAEVVAGLLWRSVVGPSGPLPLALAAAVGFLLSLVSQGIYGQRASAATWRPHGGLPCRTRWRSGPLTGRGRGSGGDQ
jgi:hypothetical protein